MFENIERNYEKLKKDIKPHGLTNIIIFAAITITSYGWLGNFEYLMDLIIFTMFYGYH